MNRFCFLVLFLAVGALPVAAQTAYVTSETDEGKAQKAYDRAVSFIRARSFPNALIELDKALEATPTHIDAQLDRAGVLYSMGKLPEAEAAYEAALLLAPDHDLRTLFFLGEAEYRQNKFGEALPRFEAFLAGDARSERLRSRAENYVRTSEFAARAVKNPMPFDPKPMPEAINSPGAEYLPTISPDGRTMVYTKVVRGQEDFYLSNFDGETWTTGVPIEGLNSRENEGAQTITADGNYIVFTACNRPGGLGSCDLWFSERIDGEWTPPANLGPNINTRGWDSQPSISADGKWLYFASKRKEGLGGSDLYIALRREDGSWTQPLNLGDRINTPGDDESPFIHPDDQTLYFMSKGHPGMGGFDLFFSRRDPEGVWQAPENLGYPINTTASEGALFITLDGTTAYFASDRTDFSGKDSAFDRPDGGGQTDIYSFELPEILRPQPVTYVRARVFDADTKLPLDAAMEFIRLPNDAPYVSTRTGADGELLVTLPRSTDYALNVSREGYFFHSENFALTDQELAKDPFELDIYLRPLPKATTTSVPSASEPIVLRNVFFETASAELKSESERELNRLAELLERNPTLRIQINGHTDNVGSETDNQQLSDARARSVVAYLKSKGIAASRLEARGFGETSPVAENDTAAGRRLNRRTEFEVL